MHALQVEESTYCLSVHACGEKTAWEAGIFLVDQMRSGRLRHVESMCAWCLERISNLLFQHLPKIFMEPHRVRKTEVGKSRGHFLPATEGIDGTA